MKCPNCNVDLAMSDRQGVEIDYCPKCRGVWLDRGELDKIIEKSVVEKDPFTSNRQDNVNYTNNENRYQQEKSYKYSKRKKNLLDDLFDF